METFVVDLDCVRERLYLLVVLPGPAGKILPASAQVLYLALLLLQTASRVLDDGVDGTFLVLEFPELILSEVLEFCKRLHVRQLKIHLQLLAPGIQFLAAKDLVQLDLPRVVKLLGFLQEDVDLRHVLVGFGKLSGGILTLLLESADAGGFLEDIAPVLGLHQQYLVYLSLLQDAVGGFSHAGVHEEVLYVPEEALLAVDVVFVVSVAEGTSLDLHLGGSDVQLTALVVECKYDLAHRHGLTLIGAVEYDILALACTDGAEGLCAQNPLNGIDDIALTAAVGAKEGGYAVGELQRHGVRE